MISTRNLNALPEPDTLLKICKALALISLIYEYKEELRYYMFSGSSQDKMNGIFSMYNGQGDLLYIFFSETGVLIYGFDHEADMSPFAIDEPVWPGLLEKVPPG